MFGFIKKVFIAAVTFFNLNLLSVNSLECISMNNQACKARPTMIDTNANDNTPCSIKIYKYKYAVEIVITSMIHMLNCAFLILLKKINVKVFNLMSRINETKQILWHKTCKCMCKLSVAVCNTRQIWNDGKCRCECREDLVDKMVCDKGFSWNPSNCECECDKSCGIGEYLDYKNCACKKTLVDKLVEECTSIIEENKIYNETLNKTSSSDCASCTVYIVLFIVFLLLCLIICGALAYFYWYKKSNSKKNSVHIKFNTHSQVNY